MADHKKQSPLGYLLAFGAGAAAAYLLDPDRGRRRRNLARDRTVALARRAGQRAGGRVRHTAAVAGGLARRVAAEERLLEGAALAQKVKSEVWRELRLPKKRVSVEAIGNVVVLSGALPDPEQIRVFEQKVLNVRGVYGVENRLRVQQDQAQP